MIQIEHTQTIQQPVARVFAFAANPENNPRWWATVENTQLASGQPLAAGARFHEVGQAPFGKVESVFEVTEYEQARRAAFKVIEGPIPAEVTETFEAVGGGTRVRVRVQVRPRGLLRVLQPLLGRMLDKNWQKNLSQLKTILEANGS